MSGQTEKLGIPAGSLTPPSPAGGPTLPPQPVIVLMTWKVVEEWAIPLELATSEARCRELARQRFGTLLSQQMKLSYSHVHGLPANPSQMTDEEAEAAFDFR